jgi:4-hydroxythreonine-4-phosphate dehydrogenase
MTSRSNPISKSTKIRVGITFGDPSGIGPAIIAKALPRLRRLAQFTVIGDEYVSSSVVRRPSSVKFIDLHNINPKTFKFGKVSAEYGRASIEYLDKALELLKNDQIDCLVTCPISKEAINAAGYRFSGHTEYFASRTDSKDIVMLLLNERLKISLATRHIPLERVTRELTAGALRKNILQTQRALEKLFLIRQPRIAVCGLNPHASDNGLLGKQENCLIKPLLRRLRRDFKMRLDGPYPADVAMQLSYNGKYDAVIAMYHDQALIPLKLSSRNSGVNMTLGLPFIRTSPLHGTAFDIARYPAKADPASLIAAIRLAVKCCRALKKD